jgi:hypothetical protein
VAEIKHGTRLPQLPQALQRTHNQHEVIAPFATQMVTIVRFAGDFAQIYAHPNGSRTMPKRIYDGKTILPHKDKKQTTATPSEQVAGMATETGTFDCSFNGMAYPTRTLIYMTAKSLDT